MPSKNKNNINMGSARPSVKNDKRAFKKQASRGTKPKANKVKAQSSIRSNKKSNGEKYVRPSAKADKQVVKTVINANKEKQKTNANILSKSLKTKKERDFKLNLSFIGQISSKTKRLIAIIAVLIVVLAIGAVIGIFAFIASTSAKLDIGETAKSELIRVQENQPYYMLVSADIDNNQENGPETLMLTRVDPVDKKFIVVSIPSETYVASSAGGGTTLNNIAKTNGDSGLIDAVSSFSEIGVTHYFKSSADGIKILVDQLGGIEVNLPEYVDDANVSDIYIPQGQSIINGDQALTLLRSTKFKGGKQTISINQRQVYVGILKAVFDSNRKNMPFVIDKLAGDIKCDMSASDLLTFVDYYKGIDNSKILDTEVPGYKTIRNNQMVFMIDAGEWKNLRTQISYGNLPNNDSDLTVKDINPSSFTIKIQNGAGISGAGAMLEKQLKDLGFNVVSVSNAENNVYEDTLIIYNGDSMKKNAEVVKNSINNGRLVNGDGIYNMDCDVLIIIGSDLKI